MCENRLLQRPAMINSGLMRSFFILASTTLALATATTSATASSSEWHDSEGGKVRLVTTGKPDAQGKLQGALEIALKPGWKTYWRDPGDSGVPPQIGVERSSNVAKAVLAYPAPQRHDDGYSKWAGYDYPVTLPVSFTVPSPGEPVKIEADVLLGICETICIPVQAKFTIDPATGSDNQADATVVKAALSALPAAAQADFNINVLPGDQEFIVGRRVVGHARHARGVVRRCKSTGRAAAVGGDGERLAKESPGTGEPIAFGQAHGLGRVRRQARRRGKRGGGGNASAANRPAWSRVRGSCARSRSP